MISTLLLILICKRSNEQKEQRRATYEEKGETDPDMDKSFEELCDFHPAYKYSL